jgi:hypothetical protein
VLGQSFSLTPILTLQLLTSLHWLVLVAVCSSANGSYWFKKIMLAHGEDEV